MKTRIAVISLGVVLLFWGMAGAQQALLDGTLIPKFVDPLPVAGQISVVDATSAGPHYDSGYVPPIPGPTAQKLPGGSSYNIHLREFQAQILPSTGVPGAGLPANTTSWVWGYLTDGDLAGSFPRPSYLGPVVVAERGGSRLPDILQ